MTIKKLKPMLPTLNAALRKAQTSEEKKKVLGKAFVAAGLAPGAFVETNEAYQAFLEIDSMDTQNAWMAKYLSREMYEEYADTHNHFTTLLEAEKRPGQKLKIQSISGISDFFPEIESDPVVSGQYVGFMLTMQPGKSEVYKICLVFNDEGVLAHQFNLDSSTVETDAKTH